jgi:hypothetical protein
VASPQTQKTEIRDPGGAIASDHPRDGLNTVAAIALLAYVSADVAHHLLGHGVACVASGGRIVLLSSIFVNCTVRGAAVDLAGPFANLAIGMAALAAAIYAMPRLGPAVRLFLILTAAFNLLWFTLQLAFSAATRTDDFAWPMMHFHVGAIGRYVLIALGALGYLVSIRVIARLMGGFAYPLARVQKLVLISWLTAGGIACLTAAFDHHPVAALLHHAAPQSLLLSIGLLFVPARTVPQERPVVPRIESSVPWILAACVVAAASIIFLGPGIAA